MTASVLIQAVLAAPGSDLTALGLRIALVGMVTVFSGLVILAFSLPLIRRIAEGKRAKQESITAAADTEELSREEIVAITTAVHAHLMKINRMEDMKLTWEMYEKPYSPWRLAGRSRLLTDRSLFRQRNRSR